MAMVRKITRTTWGKGDGNTVTNIALMNDSEHGGEKCRHVLDSIVDLCLCAHFARHVKKKNDQGIREPMINERLYELMTSRGEKYLAFRERLVPSERT